ncbi:MAG TPA: alanine dehydrogenase [bacterium]|nr:alanine dehydrogenase [bacterium]
MILGIVHDSARQEHRVAVTPTGVQALTSRGHTVFIENDAGEDSGFHNSFYQDAGGTIVYSKQEVFERADILLKISPLTLDDCLRLKEKQIVFSFHHLSIAPDEVVRAIQDKKITTIGYEIIQDEYGEFPILTSMSEMAGQMSVHVGAQYLQNEQQGRGVLFGGIPGVPEAAVVILGAGVVGIHATESALGMGGHVVLMDQDVRKLRRAADLFGKRVTTGVVNQRNLDKAVKFADVLIGCVSIHGERSPILVTHDHVKSMKRRAVLVDVSIDEGGCVETSHPTTLADPVFLEEGVIHYCVPNMTANVSRSATYALTNTGLPYVRGIADLGLQQALEQDFALRKGVYFYQGKCTKPAIADIFALEGHSIDMLLETP